MAMSNIRFEGHIAGEEATVYDMQAGCAVQHEIVESAMIGMKPESVSYHRFDDTGPR